MAPPIVDETDDRGHSAAANQLMASLLCSKSAATFRLFDLPPELWVRICRFAVTKGEICIPDPYDYKQFAEAVAQPALVRTCKTLRNESLKTFYAENEFSIHDECGCPHFALMEWLLALGPESAALVKNCSIVSRQSDVIQFMAVRMGVDGIRFHGDPPQHGIKKKLKFTAQVPGGRTHMAG